MRVLPEIITIGCQKYTVGLDRSTLNHQHNIEEDATLSETEQAVEQAAEMV